MLKTHKRFIHSSLNRHLEERQAGERRRWRWRWRCNRDDGRKFTLDTRYLICTGALCNKSTVANHKMTIICDQSQLSPVLWIWTAVPILNTGGGTVTYSTFKRACVCRCYSSAQRPPVCPTLAADHSPRHRPIPARGRAPSPQWVRTCVCVCVCVRAL